VILVGATSLKGGRRHIAKLLVESFSLSPEDLFEGIEGSLEIS